VSHSLIPSSLAEETELLESLDWDEEALVSVLKKCKDALEKSDTESQASHAIRSLHSDLIKERGETVAKLAITLFLKRSIHQSTGEFEA
jgi:hypothetical protein